VSAACGVRGNDLVAFGYLLIYGDVGVREGSLHLGNRPLEGLTIRLLAGQQAKVDEVWRQQFIDHVEVTFVQLLYETADQGLIFLPPTTQELPPHQANSPFSTGRHHGHDATRRVPAH
jgi:hypothetical protein